MSIVVLFLSLVFSTSRLKSFQTLYIHTHNVGVISVTNGTITINYAKRSVHIAGVRFCISKPPRNAVALDPKTLSKHFEPQGERVVHAPDGTETPPETTFISTIPVRRTGMVLVWESESKNFFMIRPECIPAAENSENTSGYNPQLACFSTA